MTSWQNEIEKQLVAGHKRLTFRRKVRSVAAVTSMSVLLFVGVLMLPLVFTSTDVQASPVEITTTDTTVTVVALDVPTTPNEVRSAFGEYGLFPEIERVATGPSLVDKIVSLSAEQTQGLIGADNMSITISEDYEGSVIVRLGELAAEGEPYQQMTNAFDVGEPFEGVDQDVVSIASHAAEQNIRVVWRSFNDSDLVDVPRPDSSVLVALMRSSDEVVVRVAE